jgi:NTE family protein
MKRSLFRSPSVIIREAQYNSYMHKNTPLVPPPTSETNSKRRFLGLGLGLGALLGGSSLTGCGLMGTRKPVIGLVLGAGAARGFAHIGVIKALEAQGIRPDIVVGSSAGSVIAALLASGASGNELNRLALNLDEATIADWGLPFVGRFGGLIKGDALQNMVNREVQNKLIEQMRIPLGIVATDLQSGRGVLFRSGNTGLAVRASCSVPGVFQPAVISGKEYVDGGLVAPVPVSYAKQMGATLVIAVNISSEPVHQDASGTLGIMQQTISIMQRSINQYELKGADIVITPLLKQMSGSDFRSRNAAILAGEVAAQEQMGLIKERLKG